MSFYTVLETELKSRKFVLCAVESLKARGEIDSFVVNDQKEQIEVDRSGDMIKIVRSETGNFRVEGDARVVNAFSNRLKQIYAYESIRENLPLDFEIVQESEVAGEMKIILKG